MTIVCQTAPNIATDGIEGFCVLNIFRIISGNCIFTRIASIVNHSCDPNTTSVATHGNMQMIFATRCISKGEEINQVYQGHYGNTTMVDRQKVLKQMFHFDCQCLACIHDYPRAEKLPKTFTSSESKFEGSHPHPPSISQLTDAEKMHEAMNQELFDKLEKTDLTGMIDVYCQRTNLAKKVGLKSPHLIYVMARAALTDCFWLKYGNRGWDFKQDMPFGIYK